MKLIVLKNNLPLSDLSVDTSDVSEMYEIYVGRSEDCHLQINDPLISRHHFVVKNENASWVCEKLSQLGVITIQGTVVTKSSIQNGDEIKCGAYTFIVDDLSPNTKSIAKVAQSSDLVRGDLYSEDSYNLERSQEAPTQNRSLQNFPTRQPPPSEDEPDYIKDESPEPEELAETAVFSEEQEGQISDLDSLGNTDDGTDSNDFNTFESNEESTSLTGDFNKADMTENPGLDGDINNGFEVATTDSNEVVNESTRVLKTFVSYQLVLSGKYAPYDRYQIDTDKVFIGREDKKCQIILNDPEVSSVHAVLSKTNSEITIEDHNSSNGTIVNGERINKAVITTGDVFIIGGTKFTLEVRSELLDSESERLMPVESDQVIETEEVVEEELAENSDLNFETEAPPEKSLIARFRKDPAFRKKAIYVIVALALIMIFVDTGEKTGDKKPQVAQDSAKKDEKVVEIKKPEISDESKKARDEAFELGRNYLDLDQLDRAQVEFQKAITFDPDNIKIRSLLDETNNRLKLLQEIEAEKRAKEERAKTMKYVEDLLVKARDAVKSRQVQLSESLFNQITEKDPENFEVQQLKSELEHWQKEEERKALEKAAKEAARKKMVDALMPGKTFYLKKQWYLAINKLEDFLRFKNLDEDLIKEASDMLGDAKNQLASEVGPLLGKARSLKEGQDLKAAYEAYLDVQRIEPTNREALNEIDDIKSSLDARSKKIYREAIIAESLSLFSDAKEKFQEVQQISPTDSEYYKKATEKLRNYLE